MYKPTPCDACGANACEPDEILCPGCKPGTLHQRIARVLGWTETEPQRFALPTLRAMVRDKYPKLAHDITIAMGRVTR